jgi:hypothetical protein
LNKNANFAVKHCVWALVCLAGLTSCKTAPIYDECLLTVDGDYFVADCIRPDKTLYELKGNSLDGMYLYSAEHRANIIKWAKQNCGGRTGK